MHHPPESHAFFTPHGSSWEPAAHACSSWSDSMLHGRLLGGLLARELEHRHSRPGWHFARMTVDLFRGTRMIPVQVTTDEVRTGRRILVLDATASTEQGAVARVSAVLLRQGDDPAGVVEQDPPWTAPTPAELGPPIDAGWSVPFDTWMLDEHDNQIATPPAVGARRMWLRDRYPLIAGEVMSPLVRAVSAADLSSPLSHSGSAGLEFINTDYTVHLSRLPIGTEIGLQAVQRHNEHGIAVGQCRVHDVHGPIGFCSTSAITNPALGG